MRKFSKPQVVKFESEETLRSKPVIRIVNLHPSFEVTDKDRGNNLVALAHSFGNHMMYDSTGVNGNSAKFQVIL